MLLISDQINQSDLISDLHISIRREFMHNELQIIDLYLN